MPVVPMFHANSWGLAFACPMRGAKMVMPGAKLDGASIYELLESEKVNFTAAVPTVWLMLLAYLQKEGKRLSTLKNVVIGGSACPPAMIKTFEEDYGVSVRHAWGMTEMSPLGSTSAVKPEFADRPHEEVLKVKAKQGFAPFGVEMRIVDGADNELPWDGKKFGRLKVRGLAVVKSYFRGEGGEILDKDGFFDTGDVATIDPDGYMQITDRSKDVIKSGGRVDIVDRHRKLRCRPSRRRRGRGDRHPSPEVGRAAAAHCRSEGRQGAEDGRRARVPQTQDRQVVAA